MPAAVSAERIRDRCEQLALSHNPAEAITHADADVGARVLARFIENFGPQ